MQVETAGSESPVHQPQRVVEEEKAEDRPEDVAGDRPEDVAGDRLEDVAEA